MLGRPVRFLRTGIARRIILFEVLHVNHPTYIPVGILRVMGDMSESSRRGKYAKIRIMKDVLPQPIHESYLRHRRQRTTQIILPVVLAVLLCVAAVVLINIATFQGNGDVGRWAAISTMWIAIPVFIIGLIFFVLLSGLIYLLARLLGIIPTYTSKAQDFVRMLSIRVRHAADTVVKPVIQLDGIGASIRAFFGGRK